MGDKNGYQNKLKCQLTVLFHCICSMVYRENLLSPSCVFKNHNRYLFSTVGMPRVRISTSWEWHVNHGVRWTTNFIYIFVYSTDPRSLLTLHSCDIKRKVSWNMIRKQSTHTFNMVIINLATCTLCRKYRMVQDHLHFYIWFWLKINRKL